MPRHRYFRRVRSLRVPEKEKKCDSDDHHEGAGGAADLGAGAAEGRDEEPGDHRGVDSRLGGHPGGDAEGHGQADLLSYLLFDGEFARALIELGEEQKNLDAIVKDFASLAETIEASRELRTVLDNPQISRAARKAVLDEVGRA